MSATVTETVKPKSKITLADGREITITSWGEGPKESSDASSGDQGDFSTIPMIDVGGIFSEKLEDRVAVAKEIRDAAHRIGFFYIVNHGIDESYVEEIWKQAERFFAMPMDKKMEIWTGQTPRNFVGYHPPLRYNGEGRAEKDLNEAFNCQGEFDPADSVLGKERENLWPSDLPGFKEKMLAYHEQMTTFSRKLAAIFALAVDLPENYFESMITEPKSNLRIVKYPVRAPGADQAGIGAHSDSTAWTLLKQNSVSGLQVLNKRGEFISAPPVPHSYVVNIGDQLQRQTNGFFQSTVHRVVNTGDKVRYASPFFFGYNPWAMLETLPTCTSPDNPPKYEPMTSSDYVKFRASRKTL